MATADGNTNRGNMFFQLLIVNMYYRELSLKNVATLRVPSRQKSNENILLRHLFLSIN